MQGFIDSFKPLLSRYTSEVILLLVALIIGIFSSILFLQQKNNEKTISPISKKNETRTITQKNTITVDVSGAVHNPFVYTLGNNNRIIDAIQKAGGLTDDADEAFVKRNVNYARILSDQEKIYIPFLFDTTNGYVLENKRVLDYTQPNTSQNNQDERMLININVASALELDQLPGIGKVQSEAIFNARPYTSIDDLVKNSVIKQSVFDKIRDLISVY